MKSPTIRVKRPVDPLAAEIQTRLAAKRSASKPLPSPAPYSAPAVLYAVAEAVRRERVSFEVERV